MKVSSPKKGFTLIETLFVVSIFVILAVVISTFQKDIFSFNGRIQADLRAQMEGRRAIVGMVSEMREMSPSSLGAYPIVSVSTSTIIFFSDIDGDVLKEQVRYYVSGAKVLKGVIKPTGNPLVYAAGSMVVTTVANEIDNGTSTPLFSYYDSNYAGTSSPLTLPASVSDVRHIKMTILLRRTSSSGNVPLLLTSEVTPRNLKDNL